MLKLETDDRAKLIGLLERLEELDTEDERRSALVSAGLEELVPKIDLSGSPEGAVARIVDNLAQHGQVAPKREALELFIMWAKGVTGVEQQRALEDILARIKPGPAPVPTPQTPPTPPRSLVPFAIGSAIAALAGLALVIATFAGGDGTARVPSTPHPEHTTPASELIDDPQQRTALTGEVELPPDWPGYTRVLKLRPQALVGMRAITASGRTLRMHDVRPAARPPDTLALRVVGGERIDITYDDGTLSCFIPADADARVEEVAADPALQWIEYNIGYVRSRWTGHGAVRECLGYGKRISIVPSTINAGMRVTLPKDHGITMLAFDRSHAIPCTGLVSKQQLEPRIVTMTALVPDMYFGAIQIHDSRIDRLMRNKALGITCEKPYDSLDYDRFDCSLSEDAFECHHAIPDE